MIIDFWIGENKKKVISYTTIFSSCFILVCISSFLILNNQTLLQSQKRDGFISVMILSIVMLVMFYKSYIKQKFKKFDFIKVSIAIYISIGILFGCIYNMIAGSNSFSKNDLLGLDYLYFSFITLATTGYGDISPLKSDVKILSIVENIVGVIIVSVILASAVSINDENKSVNDIVDN